MRRYVWIGQDKSTMAREFLPDFVGRQLAYWRQSTEGIAERDLFARLDAGEQITPSDIAAGRFCGGSPADVTADLLALHQRTDCPHVSVGFGGGLSGRPEAATSHEAYTTTLTMMERFGREVMPTFR